MENKERLSSKTIHSAEQLLESFSRCTKNGFVAYNLQGEITYFSKIMEDLTGWHEAEMLGKQVAQLYTMLPGERLVDTDDGQQVVAQAASLNTRDGKKINFPTRHTPIKQSEESSDIDGYLTLFFAQNNDVDRAQSEFVSTVSHELRTPITSIKGFASTLLFHSQGLDEEKKTKYIKIIKDQAERLSRLVEDLLAVSRLESNKLQLTIHPIDIDQIIEDIITMIQSKYNDSHKVNLDIANNLVPIWSDSDRLEQILTNLIDNAFKYSPEGDKIDIKIYPEKHNEEDMIRVDITDYGIGIEQEDLNKIFKKFSRLDNPLTRKTEGTGLGLFITKSLVDLLHGELEAQSSKGEKTTFSIFFPTHSFDIESET